jgi:putative oxidoreductase
MEKLNVRHPMIDLWAMIGRLMLGAVFLRFGFAKAVAAEATIANFGKLGLPYPAIAYVLAVVIELGVTAFFVAGLFGRISAIVLGIWCIATALAAHSNFSDQSMLIHFYKNVAMCGGFIYAALSGPRFYSVDALLQSKRRRMSVEA